MKPPPRLLDARLVTFLRTGDIEPLLPEFQSDPVGWLEHLIGYLAAGDFAATTISHRDVWDLLTTAAVEAAKVDPEAALLRLIELQPSNEILAVQIAAGLSDRRILPVLERALASRSANARWVAAHGLATQEATAATSLLLACLKDRSAIVRSAAVDALLRRGDPTAMAGLKEFANRASRRDKALAERATGSGPTAL